MAESDYGDRVTAKAKQIIPFMDMADSRAVQVLIEEYSAMSVPEKNRLIQLIDRGEKKGVGYDIHVYPHRQHVTLPGPNAGSWRTPAPIPHFELVIEHDSIYPKVENVPSSRKSGLAK